MEEQTFWVALFDWWPQLPIAWFLFWGIANFLYSNLQVQRIFPAKQNFVLTVSLLMALGFHGMNIHSQLGRWEKAAQKEHLRQREQQLHEERIDSTIRATEAEFDSLLE